MLYLTVNSESWPFFCIYANPKGWLFLSCGLLCVVSQSLTYPRCWSTLRVGFLVYRDMSELQEEPLIFLEILDGGG